MGAGWELPMAQLQDVETVAAMLAWVRSARPPRRIVSCLGDAPGMAAGQDQQARACRVADEPEREELLAPVTD